MRLQRARDRAACCRRVSLVGGFTLVCGAVHLVVVGAIAANALPVSLRLVHATLICGPVLLHPLLAVALLASLACGGSARRVATTVTRTLSRLLCPTVEDFENYIVAGLTLQWHITFAGTLLSAWHGVQKRDLSRVSAWAALLVLGTGMVAVGCAAWSLLMRIARIRAGAASDGAASAWGLRALLAATCAVHTVVSVALLGLYHAHGGHVRQFFALLWQVLTTGRSGLF